MYRTFDWGSDKPFSVGWWAEADGTDAVVGGVPRSFYPGTSVRFFEWYGWNGEPNKGCRMIDTEIGRGIAERERELKIEHRVKAGPADSQIFPESNVDSIIARMNRGYAAELGRGVVDIFTKSTKGPGSRERGLEGMRSRLKASLKENPEEPGLFVTEACHHFIRTVPVLPRSPKNPNDVDTEAEDHVYDEARYALVVVHGEVETMDLRV